MPELNQLLGVALDDPILVEFCLKLGTKEKRDVYEISDYLDYPESGICFLSYPPKGVSSIFLYSNECQEHKAFQGSLPNDLAFSQSRDEVRSKFPVLLKSGGGYADSSGKMIPFWDVFSWRFNNLNVTYSTDLTSVELVVLSVPEDELPEAKDANEDKLVIYCIPSLVATLLNRENKKGAPLTEQEVLEIRDNAPAIALSTKVAEEVTIKRGYEDIDAANVWEEWQKARVNPP